MKAVTCLSGPTDTVMLPKESKKSDWEVELCVVIGKKAPIRFRKDALNYVAGYCVAPTICPNGNTSSNAGHSGTKAKGSAIRFGPVGPYLVTRDVISDPQNLELWLDVNGERMQHSNTREMIFTVAQIVSYLSRFMTLLPGDLIATGTPPGVGMGRQPPVFLKPGDVITAGVEKLGEQHQTVIAWQDK